MPVQECFEDQPARTSYLPDASEELARAADLTITHEDSQLQLHTAVLACGSRVLREALCGAMPSGGATDKAAAVQQAFEGHSLQTVCLFLKLLYDPPAALGMTAGFQGVLALADKLDCPAVLKSCDFALHRLASGSHAALPQSSGTDWPGWLQLAARYSLQQLKPVAAKEALHQLLSGRNMKDELRKLSGLSVSTYQLLFEAIAVTVRAEHMYNGRSWDVFSQLIPRDLAAWKNLGDLA